MVDKALGGAGLRGQVAGETALCTVGKSGSGLTYCGYDISELADKAQFEEVSFLLSRGELPTESELTEYKAKLKSLRGLPDALKTVLENIPKDAHPMDVMRTATSFLGNVEPEGGGPGHRPRPGRHEDRHRQATPDGPAGGEAGLQRRRLAGIVRFPLGHEARLS